MEDKLIYIAIPESMSIKRGDWAKLTRDHYIGGVLILQGFRTNFASVPFYLWPIYPPLGTYTASVLLHDYLYDTKAILVNGIWIRISKEQADQMFYESMEIYKVSWITRKLFYKAVCKTKKAQKSWDKTKGLPIELLNGEIKTQEEKRLYFIQQTTDPKEWADRYLGLPIIEDEQQ